MLQPSRKGYSWRPRLYAVASVAALLVLLFTLGFLFHRMKKESEEPAFPLALLDDSIPSAGKEIILISKNEKIHLQDEADLHYAKDGSLKVDSAAVRAAGSHAEAAEEKAAFNQIIVPKGRRANITFSDGSRIYINAGSRVVYPDVFAAERREILVEGEVYLEVSKDRHRPFIVKTNGFDVKVLGTTFNVCAYKQDAVSSVVLVEGSVEVDVNPDRKVKLRPNQLISISGDRTEVKEVEVSEYISWKDNMLMLNDRRVGEVLDRLARYYDCPVRYTPEVYDTFISGKLDLKEDIKDVIDVICFSLSLHYTVDADGEITVTR